MVPMVLLMFSPSLLPCPSLRNARVAIQALQCLQNVLDPEPDAVYWRYIGLRARALNIVVQTPEQSVIARLICLTRTQLQKSNFCVSVCFCFTRNGLANITAAKEILVLHTFCPCFAPFFAWRKHRMYGSNWSFAHWRELGTAEPSRETGAAWCLLNGRAPS